MKAVRYTMGNVVPYGLPVYSTRCKRAVLRASRDALSRFALYERLTLAMHSHASRSSSRCRAIRAAYTRATRSCYAVAPYERLSLAMHSRASRCTSGLHSRYALVLRCRAIYKNRRNHRKASFRDFSGFVCAARYRYSSHTTSEPSFTYLPSLYTLNAE